MSFKIFVNYLQEKINLDQAAIEELRVRIKELSIVKGTNLLYPGELCKYIYFINQGFFRIYTSDGFDDKTVAFACPHHFLTAIEGFFTQKTLNEGIICEENATVLRISYHDWLALEDLLPQFLMLSKKLLVEHLLRLNREKNIYLSSNATKRYIYLSTRYPGISNIVSQKHIASFLGITGPTLSNLIKDILRNRK